MRLRAALAGLFAVTLLSASAAARADIYAYIDEAGVAHFAVEALDARYQLFLKGDQSFDSDDLKNGPGLGRSGGALAMKPAVLKYLSDHPNLRKFEPHLLQAAKEFSVDVALLKAVMAAESGFNPAAVSPKGAIGLMQIMPATAQRYGLQADKRASIEQKLSDPKTNIRLAARYLRDLQAMFPRQPQLVMASYNAGEGAVQKYRNQIPPYQETRNYVQIVSRFYQLYKPAARLGNGVQLAADSGSGQQRIRMTIPGRRNMPDSSLLADESN